MAQPATKHPLPTLPLHLMWMSGWLSSLAASPNAKSALPGWNLLQASLKNAPPNLQQVGANHASEVLHGILRYIDAPYEYTPADHPVIWQEGSSRLIDYSSFSTGEVSRPSEPSARPMGFSGENSGGKKNIALFIPSLINRHYILDLDKKRSLLNFLVANGQHPLVLDWGTPGDEEKDFGCDEYIVQRLIPAIHHISESTGKPVMLAGYCMGGVFSLAAAQMLPQQVSALALLATPWDFHCAAFAALMQDSATQQAMTEMLKGQDMVPAALIQALFYLTDPFVFEQKFRRFYEMDANSQEAQEFIALEHWVNDGVPMTALLAHECLLGWAQQNVLARGNWLVCGKRIDPKTIRQPVFMAIPQNDHVVPQACALPLSQIIPHATVTHPDAGHVSMIVGGNAKKELWIPLLEWLQELNC